MKKLIFLLFLLPIIVVGQNMKNATLDSLKVRMLKAQTGVTRIEARDTVSFLKGIKATILGVGITPTAKIHIAGGSATAGTSPLKFTSGIFNTVPEIGATEFNGNFHSFVSPEYTSQYPSPIDATTVVATTTANASYIPAFAINSALSLVGSFTSNSWASTFSGGGNTNQRFSIDLGSAKVITRIYYENCHSTGLNTQFGCKNFTFYGSNTAGDFSTTTYASTGNWVQIGTSQSYFDEHIQLNQADPKYIYLTNTTAYRYYSFKIADNYGQSDQMAIRRIELQSTATTGTRGNYLIDNGTPIASMFFPFSNASGKMQASGVYQKAPNIIRQASSTGTWMEYQNTGTATPRVCGVSGMLGTLEMNIGLNMDYTNWGVHRFYDNTQAATWLALGVNNMNLQYAPASTMAGDVWTGQASPYLFTVNTVGLQIGGNPTTVAAISKQLSFSGIVAATIGMERHTTAATAGLGIIFSGGGSAASSTNKGSKPLIIQDAITTGWHALTAADQNGGVQIQTTDRKTRNTNTGDNATYYPRFFVEKTKHLQKAVNDTLFSVVLGADSMFAATIDYSLTWFDNDSLIIANGTFGINAMQKTGALITGGFVDVQRPLFAVAGTTLTNTPTLLFVKATRTIYVVVNYTSNTSYAAGEIKLNYTGTSTGGLITSYTTY